jgi:hypothetical protein
VGGNSIRTWDGEGIDELLDRAHELGLTVTVGMWLQHERHGFDYDAPGNKEAQLAKVERIVRAYKDHPAVLMWGVGNEVEIGGDLDIALRTIEDAAAVIKSIDRDHPTMAVIAEIGSDKLIRVQNECPSIDVIGINAYGGLASIPERMTAQGYSGPYVITEFGPSGHWESPTTEWGAPIEPTSTEKARAYDRKYASGIEADLNHRCVGSYVFLWGREAGNHGDLVRHVPAVGREARERRCHHPTLDGARARQRLPEDPEHRRRVRVEYRPRGGDRGDDRRDRPRR